MDLCPRGVYTLKRSNSNSHFVGTLCWGEGRTGNKRKKQLLKVPLCPRFMLAIMNETQAGCLEGTTISQRQHCYLQAKSSSHIMCNICFFFSVFTNTHHNYFKQEADLNIQDQILAKSIVKHHFNNQPPPSQVKETAYLKLHIDQPNPLNYLHVCSGHHPDQNPVHICFKHTVM